MILIGVLGLLSAASGSLVPRISQSEQHGEKTSAQDIECMHNGETKVSLSSAL